eukprot:SAG31_NODE_37606_length_302_cov_31.448276_1_plen_36_part_10
MHAMTCAAGRTDARSVHARTGIFILVTHLVTMVGGA